MTGQQQEELLNKVKPVAFIDGKDVFKKFMDEYIVHSKGLFILAPSGTGKTHYVKNQKEKHFIDGDEIWTATGAAPDYPWWTMGLEVMMQVDQRSDVVTMYAKELGLWILGASQYWLRPDGIVIPDWETHKKYILYREQNNYDGGATSNDHEQVLGHIEYMRELAKKENVPIFQSIEEAVEVLSKGIE